MSTLRVSNVADTSGNNSSTPAAIANGISKAWVNFNGTGTVAIRASYNVSSITDNGTGDYTVNFTTAMVDANYAVSFATGGSAIASTIRTSEEATARTSTTLRISGFVTTNGANSDIVQVAVAIFR